MTPSPASPATGDLDEILSRLSVMEQKIDWIAHRVARPAAADAEHEVSWRPLATAVDRPGEEPTPAVGPTGRRAAPSPRPAAAPSTGPAAASQRAPQSLAAPAPYTRSTVRQAYAAALAPGAQTPRPAAPAAVRLVPATAGAGAPVARPTASGPEWWERARREGNVGRYLLSGAAALLVLLAAVTLLALVWSSIPDVVKVGSLELVAIGLVVGGTVLSSRRPGQRVAAATLTGTGGALGYVAVIGAVLLPLGVPVLAAFALLAVWGAILLVIAQRSEQALTAAISSVGAMVTTGFASWFVDARGGDAVGTWAAVVVYLVVLAVLGSVLTRRSGPRPSEGAPALAAMAATCFTALVVPGHVLRTEPGWLGLVLALLPVVLVHAQVLEAAPSLRARGVAFAGVLDLAVSGCALLMVAVRAIGGGHDPMTVLGAGLALLLAVGAALLLPRGTAGLRRSAGLTALVVTGLVGLCATALEPRLVLLALAALVPTTLVLARLGSAVSVVVGPVWGAGLLLTPHTSTTGDVLVLVSALLSLVLAVVAEHELAPLPDGPARARPDGRPATTGAGDAPATGTASPAALRAGTLTAAAWLAAVTIVLTVPVSLTVMLDRAGVLGEDDAAPLAVLLISLATAGVLALGLLSGGASPMGLLTGVLAGTRPGVRVVDGRALAAPQVPATGVVGALALGALALTDLAVADAGDDLVWSALLVVVAAGLTAMAARFLIPWADEGAVTLALAGLASVVLWWSVCLLTGQSLTSVLLTIVILLTGAVCVVGGFRVRATLLRHYGLVLVLLAVLKLALLDVGAQSSMSRVVALLVAGLICFGLSLAYNKAAGDLVGPQQSQTPLSAGRASADAAGAPGPVAAPGYPQAPTAQAPPAWRLPSTGAGQGDERFQPPNR
ncbi:DUF2339 domain-containing protein [Actinomyces radicidentis]|uniref:DUF2339 domain-containing protein n=1 Tax=Actinomyces radicidentis TaxID=111015 RepID=UPI0026DF805E|nr:DUF2339 domain-containing protein [Actinomyces radicidentis]